MTETVDWKNLRAKLSHKTKDRFERIENLMVDGMFDINYCIEGVEGWIELKAPKEPKRDSTPLFGSNHKLSIEQRNWCKTQKDAGGIAWILISTDNCWILIDGKHADEINSMTVTELTYHANWHTSKPVRDKNEWKRLKQELKAPQ